MKKIILLATIALSTTGCAKLMGGLRPDLDDQTQASGPTQGGQWPERGFLAEDYPENPGAEKYSAVGHSERGVASVNDPASAAEAQWYTQNDATDLRRDAYRGEQDGSPTFSNNPNVAPPTKRQYRNGNRATRADFVDDSQNEGSLWASDGQTNYYFTKNKIRGVGDIISIKMENDIIKDLGTEIKRNLTPGEKDAELADAQDRLNKKALGIATADPAAATPPAGAAPGTPPAATPPAAADGRTLASGPAAGAPIATPADVDVSKSLEVKTGDLIMAEIVERYPNGNYKIRGTKRVLYKNGSPRLATVVAVAKGTDIGEDDVINSGKLYEYRLEAFR
jgi:flagellar L-ring protein precursor FlgH